MNAAIRHADLSDASTVADVISRSFHDVADRFGIGPDNAPTHPSNATPQWIRDDITSGVKYLLAELDGDAVACVGYRQSSIDVIEAQRLAVLPQYRGGRLADQLNRAVLAAARDLGAARIRIFVVANHNALRRWYVRMGFVETETRRFEHLPFTVQYLEYTLGSGN
jgi:ribosomal protein S18 acetylase RimI-like enzyme